MLRWFRRRRGSISLPKRHARPGRLLALEQLERRELLSGADLGGLVALPTHVVRPATAPTGNNAYTRSQVRPAYGFDQVTFANGTVPGDGRGQTIAIVDAYEDPTIASDLHYFDQASGLADPPSFVKAVLQSGTPVDGGWAQEISLDVEWAHAIAPGANILLVEAHSSYLNDLLAGVDYARQQPGVVAVSMSWGGPESSGETSLDSHFATPSGHIGGSGLAGGVTFVASSGDYGAIPNPYSGYPACSPNVLTVGGTTLTLDSAGNRVGETGWSFSSAYPSNASGGGISASPSKVAETRGKL
jgi:subtilase family serine protease